MAVTKKSKKFSKKSILALAIATAVGGLLEARHAMANVYYWDTTTTGDWSTGADWSDTATTGGTTGVVPLSTDSVVFNQSSVTGTETVTLSGATSISGITFANTGTTLLDSSTSTTQTLTLATGGITVNSGAGAVTLGNATNQMNIVLTGNQSIINNSTNTLTITNGVSSTGTLTTNSLTANLVSNTIFTGTVSLGGLIVQGAGANGNVYASNPTTTFNNASLTTTGSVTVGRSNLVFKGSTVASIGGALTDNSDWGATTIQDTANVTITGGINLAANSTGQLNLNGGTLTTSGITGHDYSTTAWIQFNGTQVIASGNNATFLTVTGVGGGSSTAFIGNGGALLNSNGFNIGIAPVLANLSGNTGFVTKSGAGTLTLSGANTYTGSTNLNAGTVNAGIAQNGTTSGPLGANGNIVFGGGALQFSAASGAWDPSARIAAGTSTGAVSIDTNGQTVQFGTALTSSQSGGLTKSGAGVLTLNTSNTYSGATTISGGTLKLIGGYTAGTVGTSSVAYTASPTFSTVSNLIANLSPNANTGSSSLQNDATTSGVSVLTDGADPKTPGGVYSVNNGQSITYALSGAFDISSINIYSHWNDSGRAQIKLDSVQYSTASAPGTFITIANSSMSSAASVADYLAALTATGGFIATDVANLKFNFTNPQENNWVGYAEIQVVGTASTPLGGTNLLPTATALTIASGATLDLNNVTQTVGSLAGAGSIINSGTVASTLTLNPASGSTSFSGVIGGGGGGAISLVKSGTGTQTLTGANTFSGGTIVSAGTLQLGDGTTGHDGSLSSNITDNAALVYNLFGAQTAAYSIGGNGTVTKTGIGTLTLSGSNSYIGTTAVNGGVLSVTGSLASGNAVTVGGASATGTPILAGSGVVNGAVTVSGYGSGAGGQVAPGVNTVGGFVGVGTLTFGGNATFNSGGSLDLDLGSTTANSDQLAVTGTLTLPSSGLLLNLADSKSSGTANQITNGTYTIATTGGLSNFNAADFAIRNSPLRGGTYTFSQSGNNIQLTIAGTTGYAAGVGVQATIGSSGNLDGSVGLNANKTYVNAVNLDGAALTINGVNFAAGSSGNPDTGTGNNGTSWSISGLGSHNEGSTANFTGQLATLTSTFIYGGNPGVITLSGLTAGQTYVYTIYSKGWEAAGNRLQNVTTSDGGTFTFDVDAAGASNLSLTRYTFVATGSNEILTITPQVAANTQHFYGFSTEQVFNNSWQSGANWSTASWSVTTPNYAGANASLPAQNAPTTLNLDTAEIVGHIQFDGTNAWTLSTANSSTLTLQTDPGGISVLGTLAGPHTISVPISMQNDVMKTGTGTAILSGAVTSNSHIINISNGTLQFGDGVANTGSFNGNITDNSALVFAGPGNQTYAQIISGVGTLTKSGAGTLTVSNANTYTGVTTISGGTLQIGNNSATGTLGSGAVTDNATLQFNFGNNNTTIANVISGTGNLVQAPTTVGQNAILLLSASNSYQGGTTIASGTIRAGNASAFGTGAVTINSGALALVWFTGGATITNNFILSSAGGAASGDTSNKDAIYGDGAGGGSATYTFSGTITLNTNSSIGGNSSNNMLVSGPIIGSGGLLKGVGRTDENDVLTLGNSNSYSGGTTINNGTLNVANVHGLGNASTVYLQTSSTTLELSTDSGFGGASPLYNVSLTNSQQTAATIMLNRATASASNSITHNFGTLTLAELGGLAQTLNVTKGPSGTSALDTLAFASLVGGNGNAITETLNPTGGNLSIGTVAAASTAQVTIDLDGTTAGNQITGVIGGASPSLVAITKTNTSTWTLSGSSNYTGNTLIKGGGGVLNITGTVNSGVGSGARMSVADSAGSAVLNVTGSLAETYLYAGVGGGSGALNLQPNGTITLGADNELTFDMGVNTGGYGYVSNTGGTLNTSRFQLGNQSDGVQTSGTGIALMSAGTINATSFVIMSRIGTGIGELTMTGGTLNHTGAAGQYLALGWDGTGRAELNVDGGLINNTGGAGGIVAFGGNTFTGTGILNLNAGTLTTNSFIKIAANTSYLNFSGGTLRAASSTTTFLPTLTATGTGAVTINGAFGSFAGGLVFDSNGFNDTIAAPLVASSGSGLATLPVATAGSGYIGAPYVSISGTGTGATAIANMVDDGTGHGTFMVGSITITNPGNNYTGTPTFTLSGGGAATAATAGVATIAANTSGGLTKIGTGILTLSASNSYTGATAINGGELSVTGSINGSAVTVGGASASGSPTLSGSGTLNGAVTVAGFGSGAIGHLVPGVTGINNHIGSLTANSLVLNSGSILDYIMGTAGTGNAGTTYDTMAVTNALTLPVSGSAVLNLTDNAGAGTAGSLGNGTYKIASYGSLANTFTAAQLAVRNSPLRGATYTFNSTGSEVDLTIAGSTGNATGVFSSNNFTAGTLTQMSDTNVGLSTNKTYQNNANINGGALTINGVAFAAGGTTSGTNWSLTGAGTSFASGNGNNSVGGQLGSLIDNFTYGGNPSAVLSLTGLTPGQTYVFTNYDAAYGAAGGRVMTTITGSDGGSISNFDENGAGNGNGQLLRYTFVANAAAESLTFTVANGANTFHFYGFSNEQVFNNTWQSGANWTTSTWSNLANGSNLVPSTAGSNGSFGAQSSPTTINLDANETVGHLQFDGTNAWTVSSSNGSSLTLQTDVGGVSVLSALTGTHTIAVPMSMQNDIMKTGTGSLILSGAVTTNSHNINISNGTLQLNDLGGSDTGAIVDNSFLIINNAASQNLSGAISGVGNLTKIGSGTLTLSGPNTYTGTTAIGAGKVIVTNATASATGTGAVSVANGAVLQGSSSAGQGTITGAVSIAGGGTISAFSGAKLGTGSLTLNSNSSGTNSITTFNLGTVNGTTAGNGLINITGGLVANAMTNITVTGAPQVGTYDLIGWTTTGPVDTSSLTLASTPANAPFSYALAIGTNQVDLSVAAVASTWTGFTGGTLTNNANWTTNASDTNWATGSTLGSIVYFATAVPVTFADANPIGGGAVGATTITIQGAGVSPASVNFTNSTTAYTITNASGTLGISGTTNVSITGGGTVTLAGANSYSGITDISAGVLNVGSLSNYGVNGSLGNRSAAAETSAGDGIGIHIGNGTTGATLQYTGSTPTSTNRQIRLSAATNTIDASGTGSGTMSFTYTGTNTNLFDTPGARTLNLTGSNTGNNTFSINLTNQGASATNLGKLGVGTWVINGAGNSYTGYTDVRGGILNVATGGNISATNLLDVSGSAGAALVISGGALNQVGGAVRIGESQTGITTATGTLSLSSGSVSTNADTTVGFNTATGGSATGVVYQSGGTYSQTAGAFYIGVLNAGGSANGTDNISGGSMTTNVLNIASGGSVTGATGFLNLNGTAAVTVPTLGAVNANPGGGGNSATINLNGGTLQTPAWNTASSAQTNVNFDGGTLQANAASTNFLGTMTNYAINVYTSGGKIDTQGNNITITQVLGNAASNGLTSVAVTDSTDVFATPTAVTFSGGTGTNATGYTVLDSNGHVTGVVITNAGAYTVNPTSLTIAGATPANVSSPTFASAANNLGGITKLGAATLTLTGASTYHGGTTINNGTLQLGDGTTGHDGSLQTSGVTDNAALTYNLFSTQTASYAIGGSGNLAKIGAGKVILSGNNSYAGTTTIGAGTLQVNAGSTMNAVTIGNSGFETPAQATNGFTYTPSGATWTGTTGGAGWGVARNGSPWFAPAAPEGVQAGYLQNGNGTLSGSYFGQTISVGAAGLYTISFQGVERNTFPADTVNIFIDSTQVGSIPSTSFNTTTWQTFLTNVRLTAGSHTLSFAGLATGADTDTAIDNVQMYQPVGSLPTTTAVSLTASGAMLDVNGSYQTIASLTGVAGSTVTLGGAALTTGNNTNTTFAGTISDSGSVSSLTGGTLNKVGTGTFTLGGASTYSGGTTVTAGKLIVTNTTGSATGTGAVTVTSTGALEGSQTTGQGIINGPVTVNGGGNLNAFQGANQALNPVTLTINNTLTLNDTVGSILNFNLTNTPNGTSNPMIATTSLTLNGTALTSVHITGTPTSGTYDLISYSGSLTNFNGFNIATGITGPAPYYYTLSNSTPGQIDLIVTGLLTWTGQNSGTLTANSAWDTSSTNWAASSTAVPYTDGGVLDVAFNDINAVASGNVTNSTVTIQGAGVSPKSITFNNSTAVTYLIQNGGANGIMGAAGVTKNGNGTAIFNSSNSYTGGTTINAGILQVNVDHALGSNASATVASGGELKLNSVAYTTQNLTIAGTGTDAALFGTGTSSFAGVITLLNDASIGAASGSTLTLTGGVTPVGNAVTFKGGGTININSSGISGTPTVINVNGAGTNLVLNTPYTYSASGYVTTQISNNATVTLGTNNAFNDGLTHVAVGSGAGGDTSSTLNLNGHTDSVTLLYLTGGSVVGSGTLNSSGGLIPTGSGNVIGLGATVSGNSSDATVIGAGTSLTVNGTLSGTALLELPSDNLAGTGNVSAVMLDGGSGTLSSAGTLTVNGVSGTAITVNSNGNVITGGTIVANAVTKITNGGDLTVNSGATLTGTGSVSYLGGGLLTVNSGGTLGGTGTVNISSGGTLAANGTVAKAVSVLGGGTVMGSGSINNLVSVSSNGHVAPGNNDVNTLTTASLTLAGTAQLDYYFGAASIGINHSAPGTSDRINISTNALNTLVFPTSGSLTLNLIGGGINMASGSGTYELFSYTNASAVQHFTGGDGTSGSILLNGFGASTFTIVNDPAHLGIFLDFVNDSSNFSVTSPTVVSGNIAVNTLRGGNGYAVVTNGGATSGSYTTGTPTGLTIPYGASGTLTAGGTSTLTLAMTSGGGSYGDTSGTFTLTGSVSGNTQTVGVTTNSGIASIASNTLAINTPNTNLNTFNTGALSARITAGGLYGANSNALLNGLASKTTAGGTVLGTEAVLLAGTNGDAITKTVSMTWRDRAPNETVGTQTFGPMLPSYQYLASDVVRLSGLDLINGAQTSGDRIKTDIFALSMSYDVNLLPGGAGNEANLAATGKLYLGWLDTNYGGDNQHLGDYNPATNPELIWHNAVDGNFGGATSLAGFQGVESWSTFYGNHGTLSADLGDWGVDPSTHTVWAVLNHNSEFAVVVPEPTSLGLLGLGALGLLGRRRKNRA
jgi:fibronectin-binding autotransporter adhesin